MFGVRMLHFEKVDEINSNPPILYYGFKTLATTCNNNIIGLVQDGLTQQFVSLNINCNEDLDYMYFNMVHPTK